MEDERTSSAMPDNFDRLLGQLDGLPGVLKSRASTVRVVTPLIGAAETWIVQTVRQQDEGDTVFLEVGTRGGYTRLVIPPKVTAAIARQHDRLVERARSAAAKAAAQTRADAGHIPFRRKAQA